MTVLKSFEKEKQNTMKGNADIVRCRMAPAVISSAYTHQVLTLEPLAVDHLYLSVMPR